MLNHNQAAIVLVIGLVAVLMTLSSTRVFAQVIIPPPREETPNEENKVNNALQSEENKVNNALQSEENKVNNALHADEQAIAKAEYDVTIELETHH
jgi:hypothetical protein